MSRKICIYENVKQSGDVVCLLDGFNNCVGADICDAFIDECDANVDDLKEA